MNLIANRVFLNICSSRCVGAVRSSLIDLVDTSVTDISSDELVV